MTALRRTTPAAAAAALALAMTLFTPAPTQAAPPQPLSVPVAGTLAGAPFSGVFTLTGFALQNGQLVATGTLSGASATAGSIFATGVALPVTVAQAACSILHLDIQPISLNLLGLQVNLSEIVLDISAQPGPGNLLGNLLCSVAGLLDNPAGLVNLLNQILAAL